MVCLAEIASVLGDQLAKVAVSVLVFERTGSAAWTGLTYALTLLPPLVSGPVLSGLADRFPRRVVMVVCCVLQAGCVAVMILPGISLAALAAAVAVVAGLAAPFKAAQAALTLDLLGPEGHGAGRARLTLIREVGQLSGLAAAAAVLAVVGTTTALVVNAASFVVAAVVLSVGVPATRRPSVAAEDSGGRPWRLLVGDRQARILAGLVLGISLTVVPDAVIVPLAAQSGAPTWAVGLLLAADCLGLVVALRVVQSRVPAQQRALIGPLAVLTQLPLAVFAVQPPPVLMGLLLVVSGAGAAFLPLAAAEFTQRVPAAITAAANGMLGAGLRAGQGVAALGAGVLAEQLDSATGTVALAGTAGVVLAAAAALRWHQTLRTATGATQHA